MADLIDIDNVAPADSLKAGADKLNLWRARIDDHNARHESGGEDAIDFDSLTNGSTYKKFLATERTTLTSLNTILGDVTAAEANQVENLGTTTVSVAQWGYLGACTVAGGALLDDASASVQRTTLGLGSIATQAASSVAITGGTITGITDLAVADGGTGSSTAANARTALGVAIGSNVLAYDAGLSNLAGIAMAADKFYYTSADNTHVAATVTSFARSILDDADEATFKATVNLEIGTDVLAQQTIGIADDNLVEIDHASVADDDYAKFTANGLEGRSYSEVKTDLSLNLVENTAISSWTGSADIATIGTVTSGTLSTGAVLADVTMTLGSDVDGDVYYRASNKLTRLAKGTATQVLTMNAGATAPEWAAASGGVDTSGTPVDNDFAKFTDADTIEGRSYSETVSDLSLNTRRLENLCRNAVFASRSGGTSAVPDEWTLEGTPTVAYDTVDTTYGDYAVKLTASGAGDEGINQTLTHLKISTKYQVFARVKVDSGDTASLITTGATTNINVDSTSASWENIIGEFVTDASGTDVIIKLVASADTDVAYFCGITCVEGDIAPGNFIRRVNETIWLTTIISSTSFDGDAFSDSEADIDLSAFGNGCPPKIKCVWLTLVAKDSGSATGQARAKLGPGGIVIGAPCMQITLDGFANDAALIAAGFVVCDAAGDIRYKFEATGSDTMDVWIRIWGYLLGE